MVMLNDFWSLLIDENENVRQLLSSARAELRAAEAETQSRIQIEFAAELDENRVSALLALLAHEDAKTRKNAALLLADLGALAEGFVEPEAWVELAAPIPEALYRAFAAEGTKFVQSSYITALGSYDCSEYLPQLRQLLAELQAAQPDAPAEDLKHNRELRRALEELLAKCEPVSHPQCLGVSRAHSFILTAEPYILDPLKREVDGLYAAAGVAKASLTNHGKAGDGGYLLKPHPLGLRLMTDDLSPLAGSRLFRNILVHIRPRKGVSITLDNLAASITATELLPLLCELYGSQKHYSFKLSLRGFTFPWEAKRVKALAASLEEASGHALVNRSSQSLFELQLYEGSDGSLQWLAYFADLQPERFAYHTTSLPTSTNPVTAAQLVALAQSYLAPQATVMDPFAGMGTLLLERLFAQPASHAYAVDIYGEAVSLGRAQAQLAGQEVYYINRDYFDFTSDYPIDEVITEAPRLENKPKAEVDSFYDSFLFKTDEVLRAGGIILLLSTQEQALKRQLRLHPSFHLLRQLPMRGRDVVYIIEKRG